MTSHQFHQTVLREYDIRGIVNETISERDAMAIGKAYGSILKRKGGRKVAVGRDGRLSSPSLSKALCEGLASVGLDVSDVGEGPTPMLYFAVHHLNTDGGIQITGSHNPPNYNGFKMMMGKASFFGADIQKLGEVAAAGDFEQGNGSIETLDIQQAYIERILKDFHGKRAVDCVWDAGNGVAGPIMTALADKLPGRHLCLFADVDGNFPNHHPDPTEPHNLVDLIKAVKDGGYELGIGFDGDADRIGIVDAEGRIIWGDQILQILAEDMLERHPGATIIADVKASQVLFDRIASLGGKPVMHKTGHSLIKALMAETGAPLSGEMSGHIFYKDQFYGHDDALYVAIRLLDILSRGTKTAKDYRDEMPETFNTPEVRFDCPDEEKFDVITSVKAYLSEQKADVNDIDGVRVNTDEGWWLLRASNTQAVLVARAEATSEKGLEFCKSQLRSALSHAGVTCPADF